MQPFTFFFIVEPILESKPFLANMMKRTFFPDTLPAVLLSSLSKRGQLSPQLRASPTLRCLSWPLTLWCYPADNGSASFGTASLQRVGIATCTRGYDKREYFHSVIHTHMQHGVWACTRTSSRGCVFFRETTWRHELSAWKRVPATVG